MKVLVVSHPCVTPANQMLYARIAQRTGWDVSIVLPGRWRNEYGRQEAVIHPSFAGSLIPMPVIGRGRIPLHMYRANLARVVRRLSPDVVYVHNEPYALSTVQTFLAVPTDPGVTIGFYSAQNIYKRYPWPIARGEDMVLRRADFALAVSAEVQAVLKTKGYRHLAEVVPLGVDVQSLSPSKDREPGGMVGYVGRLAQEKGVQVLLHALAASNTMRFRALIVGEGPARAELEALARQLGVDERIEWASYVPHEEIGSAYARMAVLVVPSLTTARWKEQFGRIVLEALAAGIPVIASDSGELPSLIEETGGGWTVPEGDHVALAAMLDRVMSDPENRSRRAEAGKGYVQERYSLEAVARDFERVIRTVRATRADRPRLPEE
jgi:glycosyltransferase involved in cell wall biosynthesis